MYYSKRAEMGRLLQVTGVMIGKDFDFGGYLLIASFLKIIYKVMLYVQIRK